MCGGGGGDAKVEKPGAYELKLVELSEKRLAEYNEMYKPFENRKIQKAQQANSGEKVQKYTDDISAAAKLQTMSPDIAPVAGGKMQLEANSLYSNRVAGVSSAMGQQLAEDDYVNRMTQMVGLGRQQASMAVGNAGAAASSEVASAIAVQNAKSYVNQARMGMYGTIAGAGAGWAADEYNWFGKLGTGAKV